MSKIRSAVFYLQRPSNWAHFCQRAIKPFRPNLDTGQWQATATGWAQARARPLATLMAQFGLIASPAMSLPKLDPALLDDARARAERSACKMGGPGYIDLIYAVTRLTSARSAVETGVAYGWRSLAFLAALERNGDGRLVSVDRPYPGAGNEPYVGIAVPAQFKQRWEIVRQPDRNGLRRAVARFPDGVDIAHYDSDKSYQGRAFGYDILWKSLKPGGMFISDDIQDNMAFADFVQKQGVTFGVTEAQGKYVGIALKPGARAAAQAA
jgi:predicted O-methyltransferase YrrM